MLRRCQVDFQQCRVGAFERNVVDFLQIPQISLGYDALTSTFPRDCRASSLFAKHSDVTFIQRLPSLLIWGKMLSNVALIIAPAIEFGFTCHIVLASVGLKLTGMTDGLPFQYVP